MNKLNIKGTVVFQKNYEAFYNSDKFYIVNEGGSRSSKTHSVCQLLIIRALKNPNTLIDVVRKTRVSVKESVYDIDFIPMLKELGIYNKRNHNKSDLTYTFDNGSRFRFVGANDEQSLRGKKRHIAWLNEANELEWEEFKQIMMRTTERCFIDFNPSVIEHFLYELPPEKAITIHSTWQDNPYLSKEQIDFIIDLKRTDPTGYEVFALGKRTTSEENIFRNWKVVTKKPEYLKDYIYGLDFGFSHPMALVKVWYNVDIMECYVEEIIYDKNLQTEDFIPLMHNVDITRQDVIIADSARPEIIAELNRKGFTVHSANKNQGSVERGIKNVRSFNVFIDHLSLNIKKEYNMYKYKKINSKITEEPIKAWDDCMDAIRYAIDYIYMKNVIPRQTGGTKAYLFEF